MTDICTQQMSGHSCPVKKIIMIRICFTVIAYIISFLSHSNELEANSDNKILTEQRNRIEHVVQSDSLKEETDLGRSDLN